jgi:hypothetical protein
MRPRISCGAAKFKSDSIVGAMSRISMSTLSRWAATPGTTQLESPYWAWLASSGPVSFSYV